jgi:hypothetical protein
MGQLRDRMMHDLELAGYVPKTRLIYLNSIRDFARVWMRFGSCCESHIGGVAVAA